MLLLVGRLMSMRRLSYVCVSACDSVPYSPTIVTRRTLLNKVAAVMPFSSEDRLPASSNTIWPAFGRSRFSPGFGGFLSERGLWYCQVGRNLFPFNKVQLGHCLHQKADDKLDTRGSSDVAAKVEKEAEAAQPAEVKLSQKERLKRAVREYGVTVIVFHICISLFTLGVSYAVVSSGIDIIGILSKVGVGQSILDSKLVTGASTFVVAYAVHKVFAPARIACTLTATPFIVRYLRKIGFLKPPISKS